MSNRLAAANDTALGTDVRVVVTRPERLAAAKATVDAVLRDIDDACSRFRADSEISRLNAHPGVETQVSPLLARALHQGLRGAQLTGGDVDPTVGAALRMAGYDRDFAAIPADGEPVRIDVAAVPGWQTVRFNRVTRSVLLPRGVELDLGATAKALAADMAAHAGLQALDDTNAGILVSLGGDIALAGVAPPDGWIIQLSDDSTAALDPTAEAITLHTGAVATSSTHVRRWRRGGVEMHHIIDPRTARPVVTPWRLATVVAATCVDANIAATAAVIRGDAAPPWLESQALPARLVTNDGAVVCTTGWPEPQPASG